MVARTGGDTARQSAAVPYRHGGLRRRASSQPQATTARPRCSDDASEPVRPPVRARDRFCFLPSGRRLSVGSPADFGRLIADETEKWGKVIKSAGIKAD